MVKGEGEEGEEASSPRHLLLSLAPHLFIPLVSHVSEQLHYHLNDSILWKRVDSGESF